MLAPLPGDTYNVCVEVTEAPRHDSREYWTLTSLQSRMPHMIVSRTVILPACNRSKSIGLTVTLTLDSHVSVLGMETKNGEWFGLCLETAVGSAWDVL